MSNESMFKLSDIAWNCINVGMEVVTDKGLHGVVTTKLEKSTGRNVEVLHFDWQDDTGSFKNYEDTGNIFVVKSQVFNLKKGASVSVGDRIKHLREGDGIWSMAEDQLKQLKLITETQMSLCESLGRYLNATPEEILLHFQEEVATETKNAKEFHDRLSKSVLETLEISPGRGASLAHIRHFAFEDTITWSSDYGSTTRNMALGLVLQRLVLERVITRHNVPNSVPFFKLVETKKENQVTRDIRFAEKVIGNVPEKIDALEIQGVRENGTSVEVDNANPQYFSVYVHFKQGGVQCIGDTDTHQQAVEYAIEIGEKYNWPIHDLYSDAVK